VRTADRPLWHSCCACLMILIVACCCSAVLSGVFGVCQFNG
jgi:hypothetical protein